MIWSHGITCLDLYFLFRINDTNEHLDKSKLITVIIIFSEVQFWKLLDHSYVKVLSQQLRDTLTTSLRDTLQLRILWKWINICVNSFLFKHHETKIDESAWNITSSTKIRTSRIRNLGTHFFVHRITCLRTRSCASHFAHLKQSFVHVCTLAYLAVYLVQRKKYFRIESKLSSNFIHPFLARDSRGWLMLFITNTVAFYFFFTPVLKRSWSSYNTSKCTSMNVCKTFSSHS